MMKNPLVVLLFGSLWTLLAAGGCRSGGDADQRQSQQAADTLATPAAAEADSLSVEGLREKAMAVHDSVMPLMGPIMKHERLLREVRRDSETDTAFLQAVETNRTALREAEEGMRVWMRQFNPSVTDTLDSVAARTYYRRQLDSIRQVGQSMRQSLRRARDLLQMSDQRQ